MKQTTFRPVVAIELNMYNVVDETDEMNSLDLAYIRALGSYKGTVSRSYIVDIGHDGSRYGEVDIAKLHKVLDLARTHKQESILLLDSVRNAMLLYIESGEVVQLGRLNAVSKQDAESSEAWTLVDGTYYKAGA